MASPALFTGPDTLPMPGGGPTTNPGGGGNQYLSNLPTLPSNNTPGIVPPSGGSGPFNTSYGYGNAPGLSPYTHDIGSGARSVSPIDPQLTTALFNWLQGQLGQGATPFNLSALLPSGGTTNPGELTAGMNPLMKMLMQFYQTGKGGPAGMDTLAQMAQGIDVLPAYGNIKGAMQRNIDEGAANLKGQFNFAGGLAGSPFGTAAADYGTQAAKDQSSILSQLWLNSLGLQKDAATTLAGGAQSLSKEVQGMDQASIDRMLQEFIRTQPENNPLLNMMFSASTTFPPIIANKSSSLLSGLLPTGLAAVGAGAGAAAGGAGGWASLLAALAAL